MKIFAGAINCSKEILKETDQVSPDKIQQVTGIDLEYIMSAIEEFLQDQIDDMGTDEIEELDTIDSEFNLEDDWYIHIISRVSIHREYQRADYYYPGHDDRELTNWYPWEIELYNLETNEEFDITNLILEKKKEKSLSGTK